MTDMLALLRGALTPNTNTKQGGPGNDSSDRARAQAEHDQASDHYSTVMKSTNDKAQRDAAHKRLMDATEALGKFH